MGKKNFKSGFVTVVGRPNVGKSTLINALLREKIAITSPKPQTTRNKQLGILTEKNYQLVFVDTPGIHTSKTKLGDFMVKTAGDAMSATDVILYLYDGSEDYITPQDKQIIEKINGISDAKKILVVTKVDKVEEKEKLLTLIGKLNELCAFDSVVPVAALKFDGTEILIDEILKYIPEGPLYYDEEISTTSSVRELAADIIREKILYFTSDEVPHGTGVEIIKFQESNNPKIATLIEATIYCEKESHKGILIGKGGQSLKKIGTYARHDIEKIVGGKVNLKLWVKVKEDWRNSASMLKTLGYKEEKD